MLKLEKTEYDLNTLFSFDVLKEILLKLAKSQIKLENEINDIKNKLENKEDELQSEEEEDNYYNNNITNQNINNNIYNSNNQENNNEINNNDKDGNNINEENNMNQINQNEDKENQEIINNDNNNNIQNKENNNIENKKDENEIIENNKDKTEDKKETENKTEEKIINEEKNIIIKKTDIPETTLIRTNEKQKTNDIQTSPNKVSIPPSPSKSKKPYKTMKVTSTNNNNINIQGSGVSPDVINKIMKQIKSLQTKITEMNKSFNSELNSIKNFNSNYSNFDSQLSLLNDKINSILEKNTENDKKIEDLQVKMANFDVFSLFQDNGDGTIDATKVLVKSLEDKVFKKFELIDERYKVDSLDNIKLKNNIENIIPKISQFNLQIEKINDTENKFQEDLFNIKKENEENNNDIKNMLNNDINNSIENIKNNIEQNLENKISNLEKKIDELKNNNGDNFDILKLGLRNNEINQDTIDSLDKKITDLRKKMHDINNTLKLYMSNNETDSLKNELKDLKILLDKKITKDDLKELYNFHLNTVDEITDIKDRESITHDELTKTVKDLQNLQQRVESLNGNISLLQNNPNNENMKFFDFNKYIDNKKFSETLKPILKQFDTINKEIESLRRDVTDSNSKNANSIKSAINLIEDDTNNKINDLQKNIQKKYLEKFEYHKGMKSLEIQLKSTSDDKKKLDAESWLLAKKPLNCFNCASCEAKIKNDEYIPADYLAWKKYPRGEKIHRMGQGFSHVLQMMTSEFIKNIEKNELGIDYESSSRNTNKNNLSLSPSFPSNEKQNINSMFLTHKEKDKEKERDDSISFKKKTKFTLPKMSQNSKNKIKLIDGDNLPISDDENNDVIISDNNVIKESDKNTPKILKITKKSKVNLFDKNKNKGIFKNLLTVQGAFSAREKNKDLE